MTEAWGRPPPGPHLQAGNRAQETTARLRDARDDDADGLIALIAGCYAEYPGCVLDVDGEAPELRGIATAFARRDGRFWVAERGGGIVGSVGCAPADGVAGALELFKLYVALPARRAGLGSRLCELVEAEARKRGCQTLVLWSDTRFVDAHRLYERLGYRRQADTRPLFDLSGSVEAHFIRPLA